jgi:hypothetical protein
MKLVVLAQSTEAPEPSERALDDPSTRQNLESFDVIRALDDLHLDRAEVPAQIADPVDELAGVAAVGPDVSESKKRVGEPAEHELRAVTILDVCSMHYDGEHQTGRVDEQVSLASTDFLARIVTARPPSLSSSPFGCR